MTPPLYAHMPLPALRSHPWMSRSHFSAGGFSKKVALLVGLRVLQGTKKKCTNHHVLRLLRAPFHLFPVDDADGVFLVEGPRRAIDFEQALLPS